MAPARKKVVVAMSGGVDSSVAAGLLLREGYEVIGAFMRLGSPDGVESAEAAACSTSSSKQGCCSVNDAADARRVAAALDIPFYVLNFQDDFNRVIDYFVDEYNRGRTPNPCVRCNDWLKFGKLAQYAKAVGADFVASGHYARVETNDAGERRLMRGVDESKDQSYVLFGMSRQTLDHTLLPIGGLQKSAVRELARQWGLPVFDKPDSQEICFVPNQDYAALVRRRSPQTFHDGQFVSTAGEAVGSHAGHQHFTIGQRKGLGVALGYPVYVVDIDAQSNRVTLGSREELQRSTLLAGQLNWLDDRILSGRPIECQAKVRYNQAPAQAVATLHSPNALEVRFSAPQSAITPGQAVVLYDGPVVLGGGWIESSAV